MRREMMREARCGRRRVLRAGAAAAAGFVLGGHATRRTARAQSGSYTLGGRWSEAENWGMAQRADPSQFVSFAADFPFYAVAPSWSGEGDPGASVELLWSADGVTWSDPIWIGRTGHNGRPDRDGRYIGNLVAIPGASFLQYRAYDSAGNFTSLPGFEIDYIDATAGPTLEQVANPATTPVFAPPPVISRAGWGADESLRFGKGGKEIFPVEHQPVEHVIIHHADTANFNDPVLEMRSIYYFHAITRGWGDIAYNYLIDFMGNVYEGRVGGENAIGGHAEGYNAGSCGICLMGRFFEDETTPEMHAGVTWAASWAARNLDPLASAAFHDIGNLPTVCGHRDVNNTSCPGEEFYGQLDPIRLEIKRVVKGRDDPEPPPAEWYAGMRVVTTAEGTSLRTGPGLDFEVAATVAAGEAMTVLQGPATNDGLIWYEVEGSSLAGWIAGSLLMPDPNAAPAPSATEVVAEPPPAEADKEPIDEAVGGDDGKGRGDGGKERRQEAWPVFAAGTAAMVIDGPLNMRVEPGLWATVLTALPDGYMVTVTAGPADADGIAWYQVVTQDGVAAWCDGTYLQPV